MTIDKAFRAWAVDYFGVADEQIAQVAIQVTPIAMRCELTNGDVFIYAEGIYPTVTQLIAPILAAHYVAE